jgi:hypothetical protein
VNLDREEYLERLLKIWIKESFEEPKDHWRREWRVISAFEEIGLKSN